MKYCEPCRVNHGLTVKATWIMPQSTNQGKTVTYMNVCNYHREEWWVGADWDGEKLEVKL